MSSCPSEVNSMLTMFFKINIFIYSSLSRYHNPGVHTDERSSNSPDRRRRQRAMSMNLENFHVRIDAEKILKDFSPFWPLKSQRRNFLLFPQLWLKKNPFCTCIPIHRVLSDHENGDVRSDQDHYLEKWSKISSDCVLKKWTDLKLSDHFQIIWRKNIMEKIRHFLGKKFQQWFDFEVLKCPF